MKKALATIIVMSLALSGCGSAGEKAEPDAPETQNDVAVTSPIQVALNGVTTTIEDKWDELPEGMKLLLVDVTITNNTEETYEFNPMYLYVEVDNEQLHSIGASPAEGETLGSCHLDPGESASGIIPFEVEEGTTDYEIYFDDFDNQFEIK